MKNLFTWCLYDFANSFVFITFLLYFSKWLVVDQNLDDSIYNATFVIGSLCLVFIAPRLGKHADRHGSARSLLVVSTLACGIFYTSAAISALLGANLLLPAGLFGLGNFFYQLSFVFYNPLLDKVASEQKRGKASGLGFLANYLGQIAAILLALPLVTGKIDLGLPPLLAPLFPAIATFIILAIPLLLNRDIFNSQGGGTLEAAPKSLELISPWKSLRLAPGVAVFVIAFFFSSNAVSTLINNFSIYTSKVFQITDEKISYLTLTTIALAGFGAWFWGWLSDKIGTIRVQKLIFWFWLAIMPAIAMAPSYEIYYGLIILTGLCIGGTWSVSRDLLILLVPKHLLNFAFGIYAISERAATILGPIVWSFALTCSTGTDSYRVAMFSLVGFQLVAAILSLRLKALENLERQ